VRIAADLADRCVAVRVDREVRVPGPAPGERPSPEVDRYDEVEANREVVEQTLIDTEPA